MDFKEFLAKEAEVYNRFKDTSKVKAEGILPGAPALGQSQGGYLIVFRHPAKITAAVQELSEKIDKTLGSIVYGIRNAHTTLTDHALSKEFREDEGVLELMSKALFNTGWRINPPEINYPGWLYNQTSVIAEGIPDEQFLKVAERFTDAARREGLELRLPWGAHMTTARFLDKTGPGDDKLQGFYKLIEGAQPIGISRPKSIDVGYFTITREGFNYTTYDSMPLGRNNHQ